jgi:hypothetical protein
VAGLVCEGQHKRFNVPDLSAIAGSRRFECLAVSSLSTAFPVSAHYLRSAVEIQKEVIALKQQLFEDTG